MCHNHGVISGRHTFTDCVWPITLFAELCTTCHGEWMLLVIRFNVTFLPLGSYCEKNVYLFLEKSPTMHGCAFWWSQIVYCTDIPLYSLNNSTVFYFVAECPEVTVLVEDVCRPQSLHMSLGLSQGWTLFRKMWFSCPTLDVVLYLKCSKLANNYVKKVSVM